MPRLARAQALKTPVQSGCRLAPDPHVPLPQAPLTKYDLKFSHAPAGSEFFQQELLLSSTGLTPSALQLVLKVDSTTAPHCQLITTLGVLTANRAHHVADST